MRLRYCFGALVALLFLVSVSSAYAALDTPSISLGQSGHAKQAVGITAGPSGAPNGFTVWWMDEATYSLYNGQWPSSPVAGMGYASFTGAPTLNTFGGQYTTFQLSANQSVVVEIGDLINETGVSGMLDELAYGERYYYVVFANDALGGKDSEFSVTLSASTTESQNCTYTQGFWKTHKEQWPVLSLQLGDIVYTQAELCAILDNPVQGNGLVSLAHQLIAAKLNIANGALNDDVQAFIDDADALIGSLVVPPVGNGYLDPSITSDLTQGIDDYNNGVTGPGHCGSVPAEESTWGNVKSLYQGE